MSTPLKLVADIGGTNARFALYDHNTLSLLQARTLPTADYERIELAINAYLSSLKSTLTTNITEAAIAIANPVTSDVVQMTNHHWHFSIKALQHTLGFSTLKVMNDFVAQALAVLSLQPHQTRSIASGNADKQTPIAVIGPGTGLGVSILAPFAQASTQQWQALATEGGHVSFAPRTQLEVELWRYAQRIHGEHISAERFLSGAGLALIDEAIAHVHGQPNQQRSAQAITAAFTDGDQSAQATIDMFCAILGTVCSDLILTAGARGGLYLCGGILPRIADYFIQHSPFYTRLLDKGRFAEYLREVPVTLVMAHDSGLRGAAVALSQHSAH